MFLDNNNVEDEYKNVEIVINVKQHSSITVSVSVYSGITVTAK